MPTLTYPRVHVLRAKKVNTEYSGYRAKRLRRPSSAKREEAILSV
ncbi:MAG: hypothetical protein OXC62_00035 [Aestuariivita sp.]|nr:hypothetical protein [Aestuariivita sp.]